MIRQVICGMASVFCALLFAFRYCRGLPNSLDGWTDGRVDGWKGGWIDVLTDEVLLTAFTEVEWLVNSRPLTEVNLDVDDLETLTPNHFIIGGGTLNLPRGVFVGDEISSHRRWRQEQVVATHISNRWL